MYVRIAAVAVALFACTACRDFEGDLGRLGFLSNLQVDAKTKWTPDHPIAAGTRAIFAASEVIGQDDETPDVIGRVDGPLVGEALPDAHLAVSGRGRGVVWFEGETSDRFEVEFVPAVGASLADPAEALGIAAADFALVPGAEVTLSPSLYDRRGRQLGYDSEDIDVGATGPVSAWLQEGVVHVVADGEAGDDGTIAVLHRGKRLRREPITIASPDEIAALEIVTATHVVDGTTIAVFTAVAWLDDDTRLLGVAPDWSFTGIAQPETPDRPDQLVLVVPPGAGPVDVRLQVGDRVLTAALP